MPSEDRKLLGVLRKIEIFDGLSADQARKILNICEAREYPAQQFLCKKDAPSTAMYILLSGVLEIRLEDDVQVGSVAPGECVGEMGVLTGDPRSASVVAGEDSMALVIRKADLRELVTRSPDVGLVILSNVIEILSRKLRESNIRIMSASDSASSSGPSEFEVFEE